MSTTTAARRGTSVSRRMADQLAVLVQRDREYDRARRRAMARLDQNFDLDWAATRLSRRAP